MLRRPSRRTLRRLAVAITLTLVTGELLLRVLFHLEPVRIPATPGLHRKDAELGWTLVPGADLVSELGIRLRVNSLGIRGPEVSERPATGTTRVVVLGDSETFCESLAYDESFPAALEEALAERAGAPFEVIGLAANGYDTRQEAALWHRLGPRLAPAWVLVYYVSNDLVPPGRVAPAPPWARVSALGELVHRVALAREGVALLGADGDYRAWVERAYTPGSPLFAANRALLVALAADVAAAGARFAVVVAPEIYGLERREELVDTPYRTFHHALASLRDDGIEVVDPLPALAAAGVRPRELWVTSEDHHKNALAQRLIARHVAERLVPETGGG